MKKILSSASKIVFIMLTFTACVGFILKLLPVDQFMLLAIAASSFYFSNKGDGQTTSSTTSSTTTSEPFLGK